jgi:alkylation response protein AidB-like acyl-CoA dehydrogenase
MKSSATSLPSMRLGLAEGGRDVKLNLTDEQMMLAESVARLVADRIAQGGPAGGFAAGFDCVLWQQIADLGWLGAAVSEGAGGFGGPRDMAVVMQGAASIPLAGQVAPVFLGLALLEAAGGAAALIGDVIGGQAVVCGLIPAMMPDLALHRRADGMFLNGSVRAVPMGQAADHLVLALADMTLCLPAETPGLVREEAHGLDGMARSDLILSQVAVTPAMILAEGEAAQRVADHGRRCHAAALTAECAGLAARLFDLTLTYVQQREQFGQPIARFQALQHRLADMFIALEEVRSLALAAARAAEDGAAPDRALAQAVTGSVDRALHIAKEAIQLHGGVGMTDDLPMGAGLRRIKALQIMPGGAETHRRALLAAAG